MQRRTFLTSMFYFIFLILALIYIEALHSQVSTPILSDRLSSRLELNLEMSNYFMNELSEPSKMHSSEWDFEAPPAKVKVETAFLDDGIWRVIFEFPEELTVEQELEGDTLLLTFNQSIDAPDLILAQEKLGFLIKRVSNGYNTLYFVAKRPVFFVTKICSKTLTLDIIPDYHAPAEPTKNLKGAYARLLAEERQYKPALNALRDLEEEYEHDKDIQVLHATLEGLLPRWKRDLQIFETLHEKHPTDEDVTKFMWDVYTPHSPFIRYARQMQQTVGLAAVQAYWAHGEDIVYNDPWTTWYWGGKYQYYSGHILGINNNQGNIVGFRGRRSQGTVYIRREDEDGGHVAALAYGQEGALGVGGEVGFLLPSIQGTFNIAADWHRPYWAVFETLAFNGREDRILLQLNSTCSRYLSIEVDGGAHRVGITGTPNGFTSLIATAQVFYNFVIPNPIIGFNYSFGGEYVKQQKTKIGETGNLYNPVPYVTYENHTITGYLYYIWRERWNFSMFGGRNFNRFGINQNTGGISIKYVKPEPCGWEVELSAVQFPSITNQGATANYITGSITARF